MQSTTLYGAVVVLAAIVGATVAVVTGHIDGSAYTGLLGAALGLAGGAGAHAAGVQQASGPTP